MDETKASSGITRHFRAIRASGAATAASKAALPPPIIMNIVAFDRATRHSSGLSPDICAEDNVYVMIVE
jgi:hypothetical protein